MTIAKLALRNFLGAGVKAWLRVIVLSLAFVVIIGLQGLYQGVGQQMADAMISTEIGGGQYWHQKYDPQNLMELADAHGPIPSELEPLIESGRATPILVVQGYMYSGGSFRPVLLKGIDPRQRVLSLPADVLVDTPGTGPALIGTRMARDAGLKADDLATVRWRDAVGTFDAEEISIARVMSTSVQTVDSGQVWLPLDRLQRMARMNGEATLVVVANGSGGAGAVANWTFKDLDFLLADVHAMIRTKMLGGTVVYAILLFLGMITILDSQDTLDLLSQEGDRHADGAGADAGGCHPHVHARRRVQRRPGRGHWRGVRHSTARVPRGDGDPDARSDRADGVFDRRQNVPALLRLPGARDHGTCLRGDGHRELPPHTKDCEAATD